MRLRTLRALGALSSVFAMTLLASPSSAQEQEDLLCMNVVADPADGMALNCFADSGVMYGSVGFRNCSADGCEAVLWSSYNGDACPGSVWCSASIGSTRLGPVPSTDPELQDVERVRIPGPPAAMYIYCEC